MAIRMTKRAKRKQSSVGTLIAGGLLVGEGVALALYGTRYLRFLEKYGLMDAGKKAIMKLQIESPVVLGALGLVEAAWGFGILRKAHL